MTVLTANQLSFQLSSGDWLFKDLSFTLSSPVSALIGRNGSGKSVLLSLLTEELSPAAGTIDCTAKIACFKQMPQQSQASDMTIAGLLGIEQKLNALRQIEAGSAAPEYFSLLQDDWLVEQGANQLLNDLGIRLALNDPCSRLSGGQLTLLRLYRLFQSDAGLLLLDEPSNHLDAKARQWLLEQIRAFRGHILLVSHDRSLLRHVDTIFSLNSLGLCRFEGGYDAYAEHSAQQQAALERRIDHHKKEQKRILRQQQQARERTQQRVSQGVAQRKTGGQAKILLDAKKESATQNMAAQKTQHSRQLAENSEALKSAKQQYEVIKPQAIYLQDASSNKQPLMLRLNQLVLHRVNNRPLSLAVFQQQQVRISGGNGSGKSTLLKAIHGESVSFDGDIEFRCQTVYLDQHFSLLPGASTLLDCLVDNCIGLSAELARTLLAGIGFRRETVHRNVACLSGGEKMKLAMLLVSHMADSPLLLLDEPDNHLDIESKMVLATALKAYRGAFLLVSHDEDFIAQAGITHTLSMAGE
ncbi:ATP-binding cassette domain-containing protein [Reinekea marinisedimentorum]|uniref:ATPase subunit of ABC transporter with duplicated ATPase domains n=1 Tax=Reinekea marinisedimentorum TaxID=230495 RepID=A0A4V6NY10_9GAMM|nr:ATP-binding cassette domain-containing protein [Reinekea marinisedimentorum]TCS38770.1 ATPase subunit of ABC transporter with duplicated ATPase domains [Reinekea marinisedimentorum]